MRISWDELGTHFFKRGTDRGVFYSYSGGDYIAGVAWNGLSEVSLKRNGREKTVLYSRDVRSALLFTNEEDGGSIKAYTYPTEFNKCLGGVELLPGLTGYQQEYEPFGFSYRTYIGNDTDGTSYGYIINLIYGANISSMSDDDRTVDDSTEISPFSFEFECVPTEVEDYAPLAVIKITSTDLAPDKLTELEDILYGTADTEPRMPSVDELIELLTPAPTPGENSGYPSEQLYPAEDIYPVNL